MPFMRIPYWTRLSQGGTVNRVVSAVKECGLRIIVRARQASRGQRPGTATIRAGRREDTVNDLSSYGGGPFTLQDFTSIDFVVEKRAFQG